MQCGLAHGVLSSSKRHLGASCSRSARSALRFYEGDQIGALLVFLNSSEHHLRSGNVLLGVDQVLEHVLLRPMNRCIFVCLRIAEALASARGAANDTPQGWPLFGIAALLDGVALCTLCLEKLGPLFLVALWHLNVGLRDGHAQT